MKCQLLKRAVDVGDVSGQIWRYFNNIRAYREQGNDPPEGVQGKRTARCFRSEMDKITAERIKHMLKKYRGDLDRRGEQHFNGIKMRIEAAYANQLRQLEKWTENKLSQIARSLRIWRNSTEQKFLKGQAEAVKSRFEKERMKMNRERDEHIQWKEHNFRRSWGEYSDQLMRHKRLELVNQSGPHKYRFTFAVDSYEGAAYAGSGKLEFSKAYLDGSEKWETQLEMTAP